ncbi:MAG: hypothetical protein IJ386_01145 [Clostridia bacterium]|nr:hypothetical protein [Clostridia bacterium]
MPVIYREKKYKLIQAVIYRMPYENQRAAYNGYYQAELLEYSGSAVVIADPAEVEVCV